MYGSEALADCSLLSAWNGFTRSLHYRAFSTIHSPSPADDCDITTRLEWVVDGGLRGAAAAVLAGERSTTIDDRKP